jgi:hypothetical protein
LTQPAQDKAAASPGASQKTDDGANEVDPQASPAMRRFQPGMVMQYGYVIYNAKASPAPQLTTQLRLLRNGQVIFTGKVTPFDLTGQTDLKRITANGGLQLGSDMPPGEYVLQIIVTDLLAKDKNRIASQWMDFEIVK